MKIYHSNLIYFLSCFAAIFLILWCNEVSTGHVEKGWHGYSFLLNWPHKVWFKGYSMGLLYI